MIAAQIEAEESDADIMSRSSKRSRRSKEGQEATFDLPVVVALLTWQLMGRILYSIFML